jgi:4-aminobutyrate aminotransferase-like enzyme
LFKKWFTLKLQDKYDCIGDVHGVDLMIGIEIVE